MHEVHLQEGTACILAVLAISRNELCCGVDRIDCQGVLALQFENVDRLLSNPVQEIHDHVDHDLHCPLRNGPHRDAKGPLRHLKAFAWCPLLQELVDSVGERLSEGLLAVLHADHRTWRGGDLHAQ